MEFENKKDNLSGLLLDAQGTAFKNAISSFWLDLGVIVLLFASTFLPGSVAATEELTPQSVIDAGFSDYDKDAVGPSAAIVKVQVLLDRADISPGVIDG